MSHMRINDPYEPTPAQFHDRVERKLNELTRSGAPARRSYRLAAVLAACLVLLAGTAIALDHFGVLYFLTQRVWMGNPVDENAVTAPVEQRCDSKLLQASILDAYWDGETLSLTLSVRPSGDYAFYTETDRGADGESFDKIWWKGEILDYEKWKNGREGLMLRLPELRINGVSAGSGWDWVQDGQGEAMLIEGRADNLSEGAEIALTLATAFDDARAAETATLYAKLPPMKKGEPKQ